MPHRPAQGQRLHFFAFEHFRFDEVAFCGPIDFLGKSSSRSRQMVPACVALALLCTAAVPTRRAHGWGNCSASDYLHTSEPVITRAVADGSLTTVKEWLGRGGDVDAREPSHNFTMLHVACEKRQLAMVDLLLDRGADLAARTIRDDGVLGGDALGMAAFNGEHAVVARLIARGAHVNRPTYRGLTALMGASMNGHRRVANALLRAGASTEAQDANGRTALSHAELHRHAAIAHLLWQYAPAASAELLQDNADAAHAAMHAAAHAAALHAVHASEQMQRSGRDAAATHPMLLHASDAARLRRRRRRAPVTPGLLLDETSPRAFQSAHPMLLDAQLAAKELGGGPAHWCGPAALGAAVLVLACAAALPALLRAARRRTGRKARRSPQRTGAQYASKAKKTAAAPRATGGQAAASAAAGTPKEAGEVEGAQTPKKQKARVVVEGKAEEARLVAEAAAAEAVKAAAAVKAVTVAEAKAAAAAKAAEEAQAATGSMISNDLVIASALQRAAPEQQLDASQLDAMLDAVQLDAILRLQPPTPTVAEQQLDASQLDAILAHAGLAHAAARAPASSNATPALPPVRVRSFEADRPDATPGPMRSSFNATPVRRLEADRKVMLWHVREQRKLSWAECPSESQLCHFLEAHPDTEVWCEGEQRGWALPPVEQQPADSDSDWAPLKPAKQPADVDWALEPLKDACRHAVVEERAVEKPAAEKVAAKEAAALGLLQPLEAKDVCRLAETEPNGAELAPHGSPTAARGEPIASELRPRSIDAVAAAAAPGTASPPSCSPSSIDSEHQLCVVCIDSPRSHILVPCGHVCLCAACAEREVWDECPVCRASTSMVLRAFFV